MQFQSKETIKHLEEQIKNSYSLPIFKGYKAINKTGAEKLIDEIYVNLPYDIRRAREYLKQENYTFQPKSKENKNIYDTIQMLETALDEGVQFANFVIVCVKDIESLLNKIYQSMPEEITKAEILDK